MDVFGYTFSSADLWMLRIAGTLSLVLLGSLIYRANAKCIAQDKANAQDITDCLVPFKDAIANIHLGEANHIRIMRSFFRAQEESIAVFKAKAQGNASIQLQKAWNNYKQHYEFTAKDRIHAQFATFHKPLRTNELDLLHKYLTQIIEAVKTME